MVLSFFIKIMMTILGSGLFFLFFGRFMVVVFLILFFGKS